MKTIASIGIFIILSIQFGFAQQTKLDTLLYNNEFKAAKTHIDISFCDSTSNFTNLKLAELYNAKKVLDSTYYYLFSIDSTALSEKDKGDYYFLLAESYKVDDEVDFAFKNYETAKKYFQKTGFYKKENEINYHIYSILEAQENFDYDVDEFLEIFEKQAENNQWNDQLVDLNLEKAVLNFAPQLRDSVEYYLNKARNYNSKQFDPLIENEIDIYQGVYYAEILQETDTAKYFYNKIIDDVAKNKNKEYLFYTYVNLASAYRYEGNIEKAIELLKLAENAKMNAYQKSNHKLLYELLANDFAELGQLDSALFYMKKHIAYRDSLNIDKQNVSLTKYQAERKEKQNILLQTEVEKKQRQKTNVIYGSSFLLVISVVIGFLAYKNTRRKQLIVIQEKEIENQRIENILNEQELSTIDAMISGQEKERQRIASDLHDNIGATLSAAKLHFDYLTNNSSSENSSEILEKTKILLNDAYQEVRSMAHLKNSGVIAKEGLLPAVKKLAKNASSKNGLQIQVNDFGLNTRLENTLEISLFRIIQELISNIIKHANATKADISLTQLDDNLNIIIEDNGEGFDLSEVDSNNCLGLYNIEKRIQHLQGTFEIDSKIGKGTTVIIEIKI
ncbi:MAG: sensor histidine kinase [Psychroflexus sp.]